MGGLLQPLADDKRKRHTNSRARVMAGHGNDLHHECLDLLFGKGAQRTEAECAADFDKKVMFVRWIKQGEYPGRPTLAAQVEEEVSRFRDAVEQLQLLLVREPPAVSTETRSLITFSQGTTASPGIEGLSQIQQFDLGRLDVSLKGFLAIHKKPGAQQKNSSKTWAAELARQMIEKYSTKKATSTKASGGGAFVGLANLIFKAATGESADLTQYCEMVLGKKRTHVARKFGRA
jgi:hypothetical protein